jgi:cystathionine beta-lyase/cystathionine gamma-synthase
MQIADFLSKHPAINKIYYPAIAENQQTPLRHYGAMVSFELKDRTLVEHILANTKVFLFAESLGGTESLITYPIVQTHGDMPQDLLQNLGINERLLRLSIGLEDTGDLLSDLENVLN